MHRRVSLADYRGNVVLDTLVRPTYVMEMWSYSSGLIEMSLLDTKSQITGRQRQACSRPILPTVIFCAFLDSGLLKTYRKLSAPVS